MLTALLVAKVPTCRVNPQSWGLFWSGSSSRQLRLQGTLSQGQSLPSPGSIGRPLRGLLLLQQEVPRRLLWWRG